MPHAWLFTGRSHTGKTAFARYFAQALLCEKPTVSHEPCGQCMSCHLFGQGAHPDFYLLEPERADSESAARVLPQIKIDAVRDVLEPLLQTSVRGGRRVVMVAPAETMNVQAANSLLKILEEPPQAVVFLLVSHAKDRLLPTIKSRCRHLLLPSPDKQQALSFLHSRETENAENLLAFYSGAPLFEVQPEQDAMRADLLDLLAQPRLLAILDYAAAFDKYKWPLALLLDWVQKWLTDVALAAQNMSPLYYPDRSAALRSVSQKTDSATLFALSDTLNTLSPYGYHSLNVRMQTEFVLCAYLAMLTRKKV